MSPRVSKEREEAGAHHGYEDGKGNSKKGETWGTLLLSLRLSLHSHLLRPPPAPETCLPRASEL